MYKTHFTIEKPSRALEHLAMTSNGLVFNAVDLNSTIKIQNPLPST